MFDGFRSIEDALHILAGRLKGAEIARRMQAVKEIKARLDPPAQKHGIEKLRGLAETIFGQDEELYELKPGADFVEALSGIAHEAQAGPDKQAYRDLLGEFIHDLGLLGAVAKNTATRETARQPEAYADIDVDPAGPSAADPDLAENPFPPSENPAAFLEDDSTAVSAPEMEAESPEYQNDTAANVAGRQNAATARPEQSDATATDVTPSPSSVSGSETVEEATWDPLEDYAGTPIVTGWEGASGSGGARIASGELMKLPGILPPPPAGGSGATYAQWLEGEIWHPFSFTLKLHLGEYDSADDLIEMLSEFHALPEAACQTYGARSPADPEASRETAMQIFHAGKDLGFQGHTVDMAARELSRAVMRHFEEREPRGAEFLTRVGVDMRCDPQLAIILAKALDIEKFFIETGPRGAGEGRMHDIRGSIGSDCRLDVPHVLDRAVFLHFTSGVALADSIVETVTELRHAQLCRHLGREITTAEFDTAFARDWFLELDEFDFDQERSPMPA